MDQDQWLEIREVSYSYGLDEKLLGVKFENTPECLLQLKPLLENKFIGMVNDYRYSPLTCDSAILILRIICRFIDSIDRYLSTIEDV